jgi:DNA invertase Pin-like site-specific DNA recombinase
MLRLRVPIVCPPGRKLRVLIYARYSSAEQQASSITDQIRFCKQFLEQLGIEADITELSDEETSGELRDRPGINEVRSGTDAKRWDLELYEDSSRMFRNHTACFELVETAVDNDIRVICINDFVDTAEPDWAARLNEAQRHHCEANRYTRYRIARNRRGLWESGAAMGLLLPGYQRRPTVAATLKEPAQGPFFDAIDPKEEKQIYEAYERVAREDPPWLVRQWLKSEKLRKCSNAKLPDYTDHDLNALIRRPIYRGVETYRATVTKKKLRSGKKRVVPNKPEEVWTRPMPHLRIVPDWLWYKANEAIDKRRRCENNPRGSDSPLYGKSRDSRGPLGDLFVCGICGAKMYKEGRIEGGYRCKNAKSCQCWNKATTLCQFAHQQIGKAICEQLLTVNGSFEPLLELVATMVQDDTPLRTQLEDLRQQEHTGAAKCQKLGAAIASTEDSPATLIQMLKEGERMLCCVRSQIDDVINQLNNKRPPPTREVLEAAIQTASEKLLSMEPETGVILKKLIDGKIHAVPYQQFGTNKVVLKAHFRLQLAKMLPEDLQVYLKQGNDLKTAELLPAIDMIVDLFEPTDVPAHAIQAWAIAKKGRTLIQIKDELSLSKRVAHLAKQLGKAMEEVGIKDPYIRLMEEPAKASRWRSKRKQTGEPPSDAA